MVISNDSFRQLFFREILRYRPFPHEFSSFLDFCRKTTPNSVQKCQTTRNARILNPRQRVQNPPAFSVVGHFCTEFGVVFPIITRFFRISWLTVPITHNGFSITRSEISITRTEISTTPKPNFHYSKWKFHYINLNIYHTKFKIWELGVINIKLCVIIKFITQHFHFFWNVVW